MNLRLLDICDGDSADIVQEWINLDAVQSVHIGRASGMRPIIAMVGRYYVLPMQEGETPEQARDRVAAMVGNVD